MASAFSSAAIASDLRPCSAYAEHPLRARVVGVDLDELLVDVEELLTTTELRVERRELSQRGLVLRIDAQREPERFDRLVVAPLPREGSAERRARLGELGRYLDHVLEPRG